MPDDLAERNWLVCEYSTALTIGASGIEQSEADRQAIAIASRLKPVSGWA